MQIDLSGKKALVTGASSGLGKHFARVLAQAGAQVTLGARRIAALEEVVEEIRRAGGHAEAIALDVMEPDSIAGLGEAISGIDILVNNAGITRESRLLDHPLEDWDAVIDTNVRGAFLMTQAVGRAMQGRDQGGSIINIASILGLRQAGMVASYAISKAAAIQLTKVSALELARFGIRVNAIAPGYFNTELNSAFFENEAGKAIIRRIPQRRLGELHDLDGPLLLLASDASAYMTGAVIEVDGGHLVSTL